MRLHLRTAIPYGDACGGARMTAKDYVLGLLAIVSGLAITEWIGSLYRLLAARRAVKWDWLATLAALFTVYLILRSWWISWRSFGPQTDLPLGTMVLDLTEIALLFLSARASLPESVPPEGVDLRQHYERHSWLIWGGLTLSAGILVASRLAYDWRDAVTAMWAMELSVLVGILLMIFPIRRLHAILVPVAAISYVALTVGERMSGA